MENNNSQELYLIQHQRLQIQDAYHNEMHTYNPSAKPVSRPQKQAVGYLPCEHQKELFLTNGFSRAPPLIGR